MNLSGGVQVVWALSSAEAQAAGFECIEPEHLFNSCLKFAELEDKLLAMMAQGISLPQVIAERDAVKAGLEQRGLAVPAVSTKVRRALRRAIGQGSSTEKKRMVIHRSPLTRDLYRQAEDRAAREGRAELAALLMLEVILENPSPPLREVLVDAGVIFHEQEQGADSQTPLKRYGQDLTKEARNAPRAPEDEHAASRVLREMLLSSVKKPLLLVQKGKVSPADVVRQVAGFCITSGADLKLRSLQFIQVTPLFLTAEISNIREAMPQLFEDALSLRNLVLFFDSLHLFAISGKESNFSAHLEEALAKDQFWCIGGTDEDKYERYIGTDNLLGKLFQKIHLHDPITVPDTL